MSQQTQVKTPKLQTWLEEWPGVRQEIETLIAQYAERDPALHFEVTLANIELKDIDESVQRIGALGRLLRGGDLTSAELEATANT